MAQDPPSYPVEQRLRTLRRAYADQLPHRIAQLERRLAGLGTVATVEQLRAVRMMAHSLAGSGAIFGYQALSGEARGLAARLGDLEGDVASWTDCRAEMLDHVDRLRQSCQGSEEVETEQGADEDGELRFEPVKSRRLIFLVTRNSSLASDLSFQLGCFGYLVRSFLDLREPLERLDEAPASLIIDAEPFAPVLSEVKSLASQFKVRELAVPIVLLSSRSDLQSRLEAVRARVDVFLASPPNIRKLVEQLEVLTQTRPTDPYRILVVEPDYQRALRFSLTLQQAGMTAMLATQPDQALKELVDFQPDLVLMDVDLPEVTGPELASIIRQSDAYVHVPIVFVGGSTTIEDQLEFMRSGADDLVPASDDHEAIVSTVSYHAQRSRSLRYFLSHDSLTGLLNHTEFMQRLEAEFEQAARHHRSISYAIVDVDDLKSINERYGYLTGDGVIKSLAGLLSQRLRKTDLVGRYGGEEFGIIMPDTPGKSAQRVLDEVRALFSELPHQSSEGAFFASFTCGVAAMPGYDLAIELHDAADEALTMARRKGGNRVVLVNE